MGHYEYIIPGIPVPWAAHQGYGRKSYNPRFKEKTAAQWHLKIQHKSRPLFHRAVRVDFLFEMPLPKSVPKIFLKIIKEGYRIYHSKRPDRTNLIKFIEDCLINTVLTDDAIVVTGTAEKFYAHREPKTIIRIYPIEDRYPEKIYP